MLTYTYFYSENSPAATSFGVNLHIFLQWKQPSCHLFGCYLTHIFTVKTAQLPPLVFTYTYFTAKTAQLPPLWVLTLCLLVSSADNLGKQFGPRSGPTKRRAWSGSICLTLRSYSWKNFSKINDFEKNQQTTKNMKNYHPGGGGQRVKSVHENCVLIVYTCVKSPLKRACTAI